MTISALATPPPAADEPTGERTDGPADPPTDPPTDPLTDYARRLMRRLDALGLHASGPWESAPSQMAVSAQCVQVEPFVGRTVWLLPPPGDEPAAGSGLYWHWQRPRRDERGHPVARWFQPFCSAADPEKAATAISEAIFADVRRRDR